MVEDSCVLLFMSTVLVVGGTSRFMPTLHSQEEFGANCRLINGPQHQGVALAAYYYNSTSS